MEKRKFESFVRKLAQKHDFTYELQDLKFGYIRAVIKCTDFEQYQNLRILVDKTKGAKGSTWSSFSGIFEGYIYLMDAEDAKELEQKLKEEQERVEDWWKRYHEADFKTRKLMACGVIS